MKNTKLHQHKRPNVLTIILTLGVAVALGFGTTVSYALFKADSNQSGKFGGTVGLRSYFQQGSGTEADPFVISRPVHFYNLTRLQNLGIFSSTTYFTLGYDP